MDKAEYKEKLQEIKKLAEKKKYEEAARVISGINWKKVKSASTLCQVGTILGKAGYYEQARELLLSAYDKAPVGKTILYQLVELAIKEGNFAEAESYFEEYVEIDPEDVKRYKLQYKLERIKATNADEQIRLLEIIKEKEFSEEWSYELANLYHKVGRIDDCIRTCDDIILWFGDGVYVEKAMELKMLYTPLTGYQAEKYEEFKYEHQGLTHIKPSEVSGYAEILHEDVTIPEIKANVTKYNTINLQAELAKEMQQIMEATKKETVDSAMGNIQRLVEDSNLPFLEQTQEEDEKIYEDIETDEEVDVSLKINFREMLAEEEDGQISMVLPEDEMADKQITGQMSIEDVLAEWERTKKAAETAMEEARIKKLENAKARAIAKTENIMGKINEAMPELEAAEAAILKAATTPAYVPEANTAAEELPKEESEIDSEALDNAVKDISASAAFAAAGVSLEEEFEEQAKPDAEEDEPEEDEEDTAQVAIDALDRVLEKEAEAEMRKEAIADITEKEVTLEEDDKPVSNLNEAQKDIFTYFTSISGMESQICSVLEGVRSRKKDSTSKTGNILIEGEPRCGKTMMATNLTRALQEMYPHQSNKVGKIQAEALNNKPVRHIIDKIRGGYLIVENAGLLTPNKAKELGEEMNDDTGGMIVILEDTRKGLVKALSLSHELGGKFTEKISIPIFTNDELVIFAKNYAIEQGYVIDEMGVLALYNRIGNIRVANKVTSLEEVKDIVDEAINKAERKPIYSAFRSIFSNKYDDDENLILREKDFDA
ncbi:MAG: tetratricopeptide repeat protein [Eubacterium sp.]|nr:tetratricopeptide repeat protein [Eubacterium sp.]